MADKGKIGNVEVTAVVDMMPPPREPEDFFQDGPASAWGPYRQYLENGKVQLTYGVFLLRTPDKVILVDSGMGPGPHPERGNRTGNLYEALRPALRTEIKDNVTNVSPSDEVNFVVHTHLHADHVGWNLRYAGGMPAPNFRRARYVVPKTDLDYFTSPEMKGRAQHVDKQILPLRRLRLQDLVEGEKTITDEISTLPTPGHTPGHQVVLISSAGQKGVVVGDLLHSPVQVAEPGWCARVDTDKAASKANREKILDLAEKEGWIVCAAHFPPGQQVGKVVRQGGKRVWQSL